MPEDDHQLNGRNIPYENSVKYLGSPSTEGWHGDYTSRKPQPKPWAHTLGYTLYSKASV
jgi:hypothetical protein